MYVKEISLQNTFLKVFLGGVMLTQAGFFLSLN